MDSQAKGERGGVKPQSRYVQSDAAHLVKVAGAIAADPTLNVAAALRASGITDRTVVRRLQRLWRTEGEARLAQARRATLLQNEAENNAAKKPRTRKAGLKGSSALAAKPVEPALPPAMPANNASRPAMMQPLSSAPPVGGVIARVLTAAAEQDKTVRRTAAARKAGGDVIARVVAAAADTSSGQENVKVLPTPRRSKTPAENVPAPTMTAVPSDKASPTAAAVEHPRAIVPATGIARVAQEQVASPPKIEADRGVAAPPSSQPESATASKPQADAGARHASMPFEGVSMFGWLQAFERSLTFWQAFNETMLRLFIPTLGQTKGDRKPPPFWPGWR